MSVSGSHQWGSFIYRIHRWKHYLIFTWMKFAVNCTMHTSFQQEVQFLLQSTHQNNAPLKHWGLLIINLSRTEALNALCIMCYELEVMLFYSFQLRLKWNLMSIFEVWNHHIHKRTKIISHNHAEAKAICYSYHFIWWWSVYMSLLDTMEVTWNGLLNIVL